MRTGVYTIRLGAVRNHLIALALVLTEQKENGVARRLGERGHQNGTNVATTSGTNACTTVVTVASV